MEEFLTNTSILKECQDEISGLKTYTTYGDLLFSTKRKNWLKACPIPCKQTVYQPNVRRYHYNIWMPLLNNPRKEVLQKFVFFSLAYDTFVREVSVETLVYDAGSFWAAIGGNLGLFLGFSCFSLLIGCIDLAAKINASKLVNLLKHMLVEKTQ